MKYEPCFWFIALAAWSATATAQPITTNDPQCWEPTCMHQAYNYRFCDTKTGTPINKCSSDPNNEPGLRPMKRALPLNLCTDLFVGRQVERVTVSESDPLESGSVDVFVADHMEGELQRAAAMWNQMCPPEGPDAEYEGCCLHVRWSHNITDMGSHPDAVAITHIVPGGNTCMTDCADSYLAVNQEPEHIQIDTVTGRPTFFVFTESPDNARLLPPDYIYVSAYSMFLHELGHWLGFNHSEDQDSFGNECGPPTPAGSIMNTSDGSASWNRTDKDVTYQDLCMFKKLYCCESRRTGAGVDEADAPAIAFTVIPNPARGIMTLQFTPDHPLRSGAEIRLVDAAGKTVLTRRTTETSAEIPLDISAIIPGAYMLETIDGARVHGTKIIIR